MDNNAKIDFSRFTGIRAESGGRAENEQVSRHQHPERETRPQAEKERFPDYGGSMGGGTWTGRSR